MKLEDLKPKTPEQEMAKKNCILFCRTGSYLYGTNTPESDEDYTGIFIPDEDYILGWNKNIEQVEVGTNPSGSGRINSVGDIDCTLYSLTKWIKLAARNNPNILELFFTPDNCVIFKNEYGRRLMGSYLLFISQKAYHSFTGCSRDQLYKLKTKKKNESGRVHLVEKYGFDTKFALHSLRFMIETIQLMKGGRIEFPLAENRLLLDIKRGQYTEEEFFKKSDTLAEVCDLAFAKTDIPYAPNHAEISKLQKSMLLDFWGYNKAIS